MSLRERIQNDLTREPGFPNEKTATDMAFKQGAGLRAILHERLLKTIDLSIIDHMTDLDLKIYLKTCIKKIVEQDQIVIGEDNLAQLVYEIQNEIIGLGPIEPLISDPTISDILVNNYKTIFVERKGRLERTKVQFDNDAHLLKVIEKIVERVGRRID